MEEHLQPTESGIESPVERLSDLLKVLNIEEAYYIDDYNNVDYLSTIVSFSRSLFIEGKKDEIEAIYGEHLNVNVPDDDIFANEIRKLWEVAEPNAQKEIIIRIHETLAIEFNALDFDRTRELEKSFPDGNLKCISPDEWSDLLNELSANPDRNVLILFDQDLRNAQGERFRNGTIKGQHLIVEVKASSIREHVYCALITHTIQTTAEELAERDKIIGEEDSRLFKSDFLALTKERINNPELLCDGIKKTLLNGYFELIKEKSIKVIEDARSNTKELFEKLDTYDFDTTILRSSYSEGVWEANTIFRITDNIFEDEVKKLMTESNYAKIVNPVLKISKKISDIEFTVDPGNNPYREKYKLRHQDLYSSGDQINGLHLPIENGDIFQITEGTGTGYYILIGQECDLTVRTKPMGSRVSNTIATFAKIKIITHEDLLAKIATGPNHFYANKFKLDYFHKGKTDVGLISFLETFNVNLNILDLCVFQKNGVATIDLENDFDVDLVSSAWEGRYAKLYEFYTKEAATLDGLFKEIDKIAKPKRDQIKAKMYPKLCFTANLGKVACYDTRKFSFGIKRVMHLKASGASYLLERYYKHLARTAEPHDFAIAG